MRRDRERTTAHLREEDQQDNQQLRESFLQCPLRPAALLVGDIFVDADIGILSRHICQRLLADGRDSGDRSRVQKFLQEAQAAQGEGATLGAIDFCPPEETARYLPGMHPLRLPQGFSRVALRLAQFAPGMVMVALVIAPPSDLLTTAFEMNHKRPIQRVRGGLSWRPLEVEKTAHIEQHFRAAARAPLLPPGVGLLGSRRYPLGSIAVWTADRFPSDQDSAWRDVARVTGVETWRWWQANGRRLYNGLPVANYDPGALSGRTLIVVGADDSVGDEFEDPESALRYYLEHDITDWLPLLLLRAAVLELSNEAGRLRQLLNDRIASRFSAIRLLRLRSFVAKVHFCQYQLQRIHHAVAEQPERLWTYPQMEYRRELPMPKPNHERRWKLWRVRQRRDPEPKPTYLREALIDVVQRLLQRGLSDVGLSLDRARLIAEIRASNALLAWTVAVAILTAILVIREFVIVVQSAKP